MSNIYSYEEAFKESLNYFEGDELAATVFLDKYALRNENNDLLEKTPTDMHKRLAKEFSKIEKKYPNPLSEEEIFNLLDKFKYIIPGGSPMNVIGNPYQIQTSGNCFTVESPYDSYSGILYTDYQVASLMKRRAGVGINLSKLRPKHMTVKNAAKTTDGIGLWMERYSNTCREVAQGGRRGALIEIIDIRHPDIESFIDIKSDKKKVTGANVSIQVNDKFMKAVQNDEDFELKWPVDSEKPIITKQIKAKYLWEKIIKNNWENGEPGILFWDTAIKNSVSNDYGKLDKNFYDIGCNPCVTGDTLVYTDKGNISIKKIIEDGIENYKVKTYNLEKNTIELENIVFCGETRKNTDIIQIELEDGEILKLTPDHKVYTKQRGYVKASFLTEKDEIIKIV